MCGFVLFMKWVTIIYWRYNKQKRWQRFIINNLLLKMFPIFLVLFAVRIRIEIFPALCLFNSLFYFRFIRLNIIYGIFASYGVKYTVHNNGAPNWYYDFFIPICIHEHIQYVFSINTNQFTEHRRTLSIPINSTLSCLLKSFSCLLLAVIWTFAAGC